MYLTETHLHTSEVSGCASVSGAGQADQYKAIGYNTIIVTDHFFNGNSTVDPRLPWEDKIDLYCSGYENAKKRGEEIGLNVLFGVEYGSCGADFLIYGIDKSWLKANPDILDIHLCDFCDRVHAAGGVVVHAHPFREADYIHEMKFIPQYTDAVEAYNAGNRDNVWNERAVWYAKQYGFTMTAGSDCHHLGGAAFGVETEQEIRDISQYIDAIKNRTIAKLHLSR